MSPAPWRVSRPIGTARPLRWKGAYSMHNDAFTTDAMHVAVPRAAGIDVHKMQVLNRSYSRHGLRGLFGSGGGHGFSH